MTVIKKKYQVKVNQESEIKWWFAIWFQGLQSWAAFNILLLRIMVGTRLTEQFGPSYLVNKLLSIFLLARNDMKKLLIL